MICHVESHKRRLRGEKQLLAYNSLGICAVKQLKHNFKHFFVITEISATIGF